MLETGNLGGKCADLNALYVGLARAAGLPARDVYGIRVAKSERGYKSLGRRRQRDQGAALPRGSLPAGNGWVPVDPADVRKVVLEELPGNRALDDPLVQRRARGSSGLGDELDGLQLRSRRGAAWIEAGRRSPSSCIRMPKRPRPARQPRSRQLQVLDCGERDPTVASA